MATYYRRRPINPELVLYTQGRMPESVRSSLKIKYVDNVNSVPEFHECSKYDCFVYRQYDFDRPSVVSYAVICKSEDVKLFVAMATSGMSVE